MIKINVVSEGKTVSLPLEPEEKREKLVDNLKWMLQPASDLCDLYEEHNRHVAIIGFSTEEALAKDTEDGSLRSPMVCNMSRTEFACGLAGAIYSYARRNDISVRELVDEISRTTLDCQIFADEEMFNGGN